MKTNRPPPFERTGAESPVNRDGPKEEFSPIHSRYSSLSFHKVLIFYQSIPLNKEFTFSISTSRNIPIYYLQTCEIIYQGVKHIQQVLQSPPFSNVFQGFILDTSHIATPIRIKISNSQVANPSATNSRIPYLVTIMTTIHKY